MNSKILLLTAVLTGTALTLAAVQADTVYRWMDKHGQVHYSQTPPPGARTRVKAVHINAPPPDAVMLQQIHSLEKFAKTYRKTHRQQAVKAEKQAEKQAREQQHCAAARTRLRRYLAAHPALPQVTANAMGYYPYNDALIKARQRAEKRTQRICNGN
ncbi:MAG: DUF4124 domain-containing protein [Gammaproteobacteria bacterium]